MSWIQKQCEFSGKGIQGMYEIKKNHIQVAPEYRAEFMGREHVLFIFRPAKIIYFESVKDCYRPDLAKHYWEYSYCFYCPSKGGVVGGQYWNTSYEIGTVKRKLRRMVGFLNVLSMPLTLDEWNASVGKTDAKHFEDLYLRYLALKVSRTLPKSGERNSDERNLSKMMGFTEHAASVFRLDLINLMIDTLDYKKLKPILLIALLRSCSRFKKHLPRYNEILNYAYATLPNAEHRLRGLKLNE